MYARTGYLGFLRRTESCQSSLDETFSNAGNKESDNDSVKSQTNSSFVNNSLTHADKDFKELDQRDAVYVVGALDETITLRGMNYHPIDIENSVLRCHRKISEWYALNFRKKKNFKNKYSSFSAVFTWTNLLVVVVELDGNESEALDLVPLVTNNVLEDHQLIVGVIVVVDPGKHEI